ncbi:helix-turn-helix transcriptional regulator, partial [Tyzzerella sp. OttesenSCG-928-J15]|nr:helix-turn-helix transcriptional regulator [Tyzzerella sp. OttesenSCG-928-J15]
IGLIERGQRGTKFDNLVKLCQIFDCTLSELMSEISIEPYPVNKQRIDPLLEEYLVEHDFSNPHKAKHLMAMIDAGENVFGKVSDRTI